MLMDVIEKYLELTEDTILHYDYQEKQYELEELSLYFNYFNEGDTQRAIEYAPLEIKPYLEEELKLSQEIEEMERLLEEELNLKDLKQYLDVAPRELFSIDVSDLISKIKNKDLVFELVEPILEEEKLSLYVVDNKVVMDEEEIEQFLNSFGDYKSIVEEKMIHYLISYDNNRVFVLENSEFYNHYVLTYYQKNEENLMEMYNTLLDEELEHIKESNVMLEIIPMGDEEKSILQKIILQKANNIIRNSESEILRFIRKPVSSLLRNKMHFEISDYLLSSLELLKELEQINALYNYEPFYNDKEIQIMQMVRSLAEVNSERVPIYFSVLILSDLKHEIVNVQLYNKIFEVELQSAKEYFYAHSYDSVKEIEELLESTKIDYIENFKFICNKAKFLIGNANTKLAVIDTLNLSNDLLDNIRFSEITGMIEKIAVIWQELYESIEHKEEQAEFLLIGETLHEECQKCWKQEKIISETMLECLHAYQQQYRRLCEDLELYWMMPNFALVLFEERLHEHK